jgi:murein DD-endopeptidase MepM/ murein hydrolase activator NlpD
MISPGHCARHATLLGLALAMLVESAAAQTKPTESAAPRAVSRSAVDWISRFEAPLPDAAFGAGWGVSTDQAAGGRSTARLSVVHGGATGSPHALSVEGVVDGALPYAWAGASFYPGEVRYGPADLSSKDSLVFWARSNGATFRVMLLSTAPDGREAPAVPSQRTARPQRAVGGTAVGTDTLDPCGEYAAPDESAYTLPFPRGRGYRLSQGNCSRGSHGPGTPYRFAFDFVMPIGDTITAARAGKVVAVEQDFQDGTLAAGEENELLIEHDDGSIARYVHLTHRGALVRVGERVQQGQSIARSGNSGMSRGPHLHFDVATCEYHHCATLPVSFRNAGTSAPRLLDGLVYVAR